MFSFGEARYALIYKLEGAIEFDEGYLEKATSSKVKLKRAANVDVLKRRLS